MILNTVLLTAQENQHLECLGAGKYKVVNSKVVKKKRKKKTNY